MKSLRYLLNLPWTLVMLGLALLSLPCTVATSPDALVFTVRSFWWRFHPGARAMTLGNVILLGPATEPGDYEHELVHIEHQKLDLDEIQSKDPAEVIEHKVRQAYDLVQRPVFVDDFSLWFDELNGLPGPFIKFFVDVENGLENMCRMLDGFDSRRATARAYFGYYDGQKIEIIYGELHGNIVDHPRGNADYAFGSDPIFAVDGYGGRTRAEVSREEYDEIYRRVRAIDQVREFLKSKE